MAAAVSEISWLLGVLKELNVNVIVPVKLHCDSKAAIQIGANPIFHERTKHIEIDCHFVREKNQKWYDTYRIYQHKGAISRSSNQRIGSFSSS